MKYPKTKYVGFSPSKDNTDVKECGLFNLSNFINKPLIITAKLDGSNCLLDCNHVAARNGRIANHLSFDIIKSMHSGFKDKIPENLIIFGENLYAKHSIYYNDLESYLYIFAIYDTIKMSWSSWDDVKKLASDIKVPTVPEISKLQLSNINDLTNVITEFGNQYISSGGEGIVIRNASEFLDFGNNVAKYVRKNHVNTEQHWSQQKIIRNSLCK